MAQNVYDQPEFFDGYSRLTRSVEGLDGAAEWPAMRAMLPDPRGLGIVDLGCGYGWFCRWALAQGAARVIGLDVSEKMLAKARSASPSGEITYELSDLERLDLPPASFDIAYSSLALHYIEDAGRLFATVHRALKPGGSLVFSTEHPIFMAPSRPGWRIDAEGNKTWPLDRYFIEGPRITGWLGADVIKHHRTIGTTYNLLIKAGFTVTRLEEFCPDRAQIAARPELVEELERPMFLLMSARR